MTATLPTHLSGDVVRGVRAACTTCFLLRLGDVTMRANRFYTAVVLGLGLLWAVFSIALGLCRCLADVPHPVMKPKEEPAKPPVRPGEEKKKLPEWDKVVDGAKRLEGLFPLYYNEKEQKLFMEIRQDQYDKEMILPIAIARGAGHDVSRRRHAELRRSVADQLSPRRRPPAGDPAQCSLPGRGRLAAGRRREGLVHRQRHQGPADQERKERRANAC